MPEPPKSTKAPAAPAQQPAPATGQPEDSELVLTPGGWRPKSQVQQLEPGHHISGKGGRLRIIETRTGKVIRDLGVTSKKKPIRGKRVGNGFGSGSESA
jgi:hypothetical protein